VASATAELREAVFKLRLAGGGRVDADFVLTLRTPEGVEHWGFDWNLQDIDIDQAAGDSPRDRFDDFMRSLFEDHMHDLAERGLEADRRYEDLPIRLEIPDEIRPRLR
jgi:hypothetical protein